LILKITSIKIRKLINKALKMKTSCGIIIINEKEEIFMGHSTGNKFYDIPKGLLEENETPIDCALRECEEETSLKFKTSELNEIGLLPYNKEKNLHLFLVHTQKESIILENLVCNSFFEHHYTKKTVPEVDSFRWIPFSEIELNCAKSMGKLLLKLINEKTISISNKKIKL
jgi:8-oxo-dGTP pyrophosphatase MutT (NUDIX family)